MISCHGTRHYSIFLHVNHFCQIVWRRLRSGVTLQRTESARMWSDHQGPARAFQYEVLQYTGSVYRERLSRRLKAE